jgi:hypothetical protein
MKKRAKAGNKKQGRNKAKVSAKSRPSAKSSAKKARGKRKPTAKRAPRQRIVVQGSQSVETVPMKGRAMRAGAGAGGGDFGGVSVVENVDSESAEELLKEGQAFEAGIVSGVEDAPDADQGPVRTREVSQDDVPKEYEDKDRPI